MVRSTRSRTTALPGRTLGKICSFNFLCEVEKTVTFTSAGVRPATVEAASMEPVTGKDDAGMATETLEPFATGFGKRAAAATEAEAPEGVSVGLSVGVEVPNGVGVSVGVEV